MSTEKIKKLVINRRRWLRGKSKDVGFLLSPESGRMCCLGFYMTACGFSPEFIENVGTPSGLFTEPKNNTNHKHNLMTKLLKDGGAGWLIRERNPDKVVNTDDALKLMDVNDSRERSAAEREQKIKKIFKKHGVRVIFK